MADLNEEIIVKLYSKLSSVLSVGSSIQAPGHSFLALLNPGMFLDPNLDLDKPDNQFLWASILNRIPLPSFIYEPASTSMNELYDIILTYKELPTSELTPEQQELLNKALAVLYDKDGDPSDKLLKYFSYETEYYAVLTEYQEAVVDARNEGKPIPPSLVTKLNQAKRRWDLLGYRAKIDAAASTVNNLLDLDVNTWWGKLRTRFDNNQRKDSSGNDYPLTLTAPDYKGIVSSKGWTKLTFNQDDVFNQEKVKSVDTGGGVSVNWGLWRASGEASYKRDEGYVKSTTDAIDVKLEVKRVQISRPWLDGLVFRSRAWRWHESTPIKELISNGADASRGQTPVGVMPLFPTTLIVARNVEMTGNFSSEESSWLDEALKTKASVGWGPFSFSGHYNQEKHEKESEGHRAGNTVANADPQIIGMFCEVLPTMPNPNPALHWPSEITLAHLPEFNEAGVKKAKVVMEMKLSRSRSALETAGVR